jgi:ribokinase
VLGRYRAQIVVIGLGQKGALLAVRDDDYLELFPAVQTRQVVNTIGAGDALFASFLHCYLDSGDPYLALRKAIVFASYKIGAAGATEGFLSTPAFDRLSHRFQVD